MHCFLIRNRATLLWFVREASGNGIAALFAKCAVIFAKHAAIRRTHRIFMAKGATIQELRCFTRQRTATRPSKCGAFGWRKAAHMPPCFQVPPRHVCCTLFDVYIYSAGHQESRKCIFSLNVHFLSHTSCY